MVETTTTRGGIERGSAIQRHFVRDVDNNIDGAYTVCSYSSGGVSVCARSMEAVRECLRAAHVWGLEPSFDLENNDMPTGLYTSGDVALSFEM